jgi:hypothetical protein
LAASGCLLESHVPTDPILLEGFCDAFFDALCEPIEACACGPAVAACRAEQRDLCSSFPSAALVGAVDVGAVRYDAAAASALVRRTRARAESCEGFVDSLGWRVRDLFALGGVFEGTRAAGEGCDSLGFELVSECALGSCAPVPDGHVCRANVGEGARCDATHQCVDLDALLTVDIGIERLALRCLPDAPGAETGTCARWVDDGGSCGSDDECWSGRCDGSRCASVSIGAACTSSRECASSYCSPSDRVCAAGDAALGEPCDDNSACTSHVCIAGACMAPGCGTF